MLSFDDGNYADVCLKSIGNWVDPLPAPVIEEHEGVYVVRDDLLETGSKSRVCDYLIGHDPRYSHIEEWIYGSSPATGYAQISLPYLCGRYGKKAVIFMAKRDLSKLHDYQKRGLANGGDYRWVNMGMLTVTESHAKKYAAEKPETRMVVPIGLEHETVFGSFIRVARNLPIKPDVVWTVGSSGTLTRGLQLAWPDAEFHCVSVGHAMSEKALGRANYYKSPYKFDQAVKPAEMPPFPSAPTYDAKAWTFIRDYMKTKPSGKVLFWNVGA